MAIDQKQLIEKYNVAAPRYTSYPTVPYWEEDIFSDRLWRQSVRRSFEESNESEGISLYIHLPFCESLCTFCGCNKRITKNHSVESPYIDAVLAEWKMYLDLLPGRPRIKDLHIGGGTPTFFSPAELERLLSGIFSGADKAEGATFGFEGHPNNTTYEHLQILYKLGFRRVSYGIQDFDPKVQSIINRVQSFEAVKQVTDWSREIGYESVNYDVIYGLPLQNLESVKDTMEKVRLLKPDRIAYYSYAHVPWIKGNGQRRFTEEDLPQGEQKRKLYEEGRSLLEQQGYVEIGMDHFAFSEDTLYKAMCDKTLHRNFMGYTPFATQLMIGLGVSAISDSWYAFAQNVKMVEEYEQLISEGILPVFRGHHLTEEDLSIRRHILNIMCHFETRWQEGDRLMEVEVLPRLLELQQDGLLQMEDQMLKVLMHGRPFVRNICMAFDARLWRKQPGSQLFSMAV